MDVKIGTTRISDLNDRGGPSMNGMPPFGNSTYMTMDVHPNPYGIQKPALGDFPAPIQTKDGPKQYPSAPYNPNANYDLSPQQIAALQEMPPQHLPANNMPLLDSGRQDPMSADPNYIPKLPKTTKDYIADYQESTDRKLREYEEQKMREKQMENWFDSLKTPVLIAVLYFVFNMPIVNKLIFKQFSFLSIHNADGNFNLGGLILKCSLFGSLYYVLDKSMRFLV